ncbi:MAG: ATP-binding cassette domain-containing protein [Eubacteriales bacterium]|nr:ATP-binding cassette domain-containing protein [Eubacteriales bacterium]
MTEAVKLVKVSKSFGKEHVLKEISHSFETGKIHGIVGFNGSGKTVMFKCICGFLKPDSGYVKVQGKQIGKEVDFPKSLGMIIESPGFLPHLSGYVNLKRLANLQKIIGKEEVMDAITRVGLDPCSKKKVGQYSLGMRERLGIAQAIMENQELLILDEPFNGLDKRGVTDVCRLFEELREQGKTILLAAHNMPDMEGFCDTICEMDAGVLTQVK